MRSRKSFSFVEILFAVGILSTSLVALLSFFSTTFASNETSYTTSVAINHAGSILEQIRGKPLDTFSAELLKGDWTLDTAAVEERGLVPLSQEKITAASLGDGPLTVTVTVTWVTQQRPRSVTLTTIMGGI